MNVEMYRIMNNEYSEKKERNVSITRQMNKLLKV